jgi:DUF4097 and DUF4098 domain-containing protein YvlB
MIAPQMLYAKSRMHDTVNSLFKRTIHEEIVQKEYPLKGRKSVYIKNIRGTITVKSEWTNQSLLVTATKKAPKAEYLDLVTIDDSKSDKTCINIETVYLEKNKKTAGLAKSSKPSKASIDYVLLVPQNVRLELVSDNGNIVVKEVNGQIVARTCNNGNIEIENAQNSIYAQVEKNGSIFINQANNNVKAFAHQGNIIIHNAKKGIIAQTDKGRLDIECLKLPSTSKVSLNTRSGNITLRIPETTNAELQAHTDKGTLTCAHYLTVKPMTTQLNPNAWTRFKREVEGVLGSGEATITVHSTNGHIKIVDATA